MRDGGCHAQRRDSQAPENLRRRRHESGGRDRRAGADGPDHEARRGGGRPDARHHRAGGPDPEPPHRLMTVALTDASGVRLALDRPPRRIVSLIPSTTELLCALGLAEALVGVTNYCREPADVVRTRTRIGGEKDPDVEKILALQPDLVVANVEENQPQHVAALRARGVPVWVTYPRTVADAILMIRELGALTGARARAAGIADEGDALLAGVSAQAARRGPPRGFFAHSRRPRVAGGPPPHTHPTPPPC